MQMRIPLAIAALVVSSTAFAQSQYPMRSDQYYEPRSYTQPMDDYRQQAQVPLAQPLPNGTTRDPNGMLQRDRFGNIVRGDSCADHWSNCAYDPSR